MARAMSRHAGVVRDRAGTERLLGMLDQAPAGDGTLSLAVVEATSLHTVSVLVAAAALARAESRGCHRWRDVPVTSAGPARHTVVRVRDGHLRIMSGTGARA
jgi:L-aspartate oxidase